MNETALEMTQIHDLHVLAGVGALCIFGALMAYFIWLGWMFGRPQGVKREIIGRALREMPASQDPIVAKRQAKLLEEFREKLE